jgi:hypothetical protein
MDAVAYLAESVKHGNQRRRFCLGPLGRLQLGGMEFNPYESLDTPRPRRKPRFNKWTLISAILLIVTVLSC